jgi:hypothetical protein
MDRHNNVLAVEIGQTARTWSNVEQGAREVIERSRGDGSTVARSGCRKRNGRATQGPIDK